MKIWGVEIKDEIRMDKLYWRLFIHNPFQMYDGRYRFGINEKIISCAQESGVYEFIIGEKFIRVPSKKGLKLKIKQKEYEDKPSLFVGCKPIRIYYFII